MRRLGVPAQALVWIVGTGAATAAVTALAPGPLLGRLTLPAPGQLEALAIALAMVGALTAVALTGVLHRVPWPAFLAVGFLGAVLFPLVLSLATVGRGADVGRPTDGYAAAAEQVGDEPVRYLRHYDDRTAAARVVDAATTHPPARTIAVRVVDALGASPGTAAAVVLTLIGGLAVPLLCIAVRSLSHDEPTRDLLPVLLTLPALAVVWGATDQLVAVLAAGSLAWGVTGANRRRGLVSAAGAGLLLGCVALVDYAAPWGVAAALACTYFARRRPLLNLVTGVSALVPLALFSHAGFDWPTGLELARDALSDRSAMAWLIPSVLALLIAAGPALIGSAASLRRTPGWPLLVGGAAAVLASLVLGLARGGAERAWWTATLLLVSAATATPADRRGTPWLVGVGGVTAVLLAGCFEPIWVLG